MKNKIYLSILALFLFSSFCSCKMSTEPVVTYNAFDGTTMSSDDAWANTSEASTEEIYSSKKASAVSDKQYSNDLAAVDAADKTSICVSVMGEVLNPGVYYLDEGSRIFELINAAGGVTKDADCSELNLVYVLSDGIQIRIPSLHSAEESERTDTEDKLIIFDANTNPGTTKEISSTSENIASNSPSKININAATENELTHLTGIGQTRAEAIVEYREKNGKFKNISEIMNVPGIKEGTFDKIKDFICAD